MMPAAVVFDLYGTLLDFSSLAGKFTSTVASPDAFVAAWRAKQLAYAMAATIMERYADFDEITDRAYAYAAALHAAPVNEDARRRATDAWATLPAFSDVAGALATLQARGIPTAVLSNGTPRAIARALAHGTLTDRFAHVMSVDAVRRFKPHRDVYTLATQAFACEPARIVFVSSNGWDATGAAEFGFRVVWCNRGKSPAETFGASPAATISSLDDLANVLE